jgi:ketosteroid isomerase-like protein
MKPVIALCLFAAFASTPGAAPPAGPVPQDAGIEVQIRKLNAEEVRALLKNDARELDRLWAEDFVVTNPFNVFLTKPQVLAQVRADAISFSAYERHVDYVRRHGDSVVVAGRETVGWAGKMPIAGTTSNLRFTSVWKMQDGRWREVARHASTVLKRE